MGRTGGITFIAALMWLLAAKVQAQAQSNRATVSTQIDDCVPIDRNRFHRLLKVELGTNIEYVTQPDASQQAGSLAAILITCIPGGVQLLLEDRLTRKSMRRAIALENIAPQSRSRLMALTAAEFVFASWLELRLPKPMVREVIEPQEVPPPITALYSAERALDEKAPVVASSEPTWQLAAALELMAFSSAFELIPCLALRLSHALTPGVGLRLAVQAGRGTLDGQIESEPTSVDLTTTSLLAGVTYDGTVGAFELYVGGGARFGFAYVSGAEPRSSQDGETQLNPVGSYAPWAGIAILMGATLRAGEHARILLGIEAGWLLLDTVAVVNTQTATGTTATPVVELKGAWGLASVGAGWAF